MKNPILLIVSLFAITATASKPNFVFIFVDDMGWTGTSVEMIKRNPETNALGAVGSDEVVYTRLPSAPSKSYTIVDSGQFETYGNTNAIAAPSAGSSFYGQDAQHDGVQPSFINHQDGTITDANTGLMWQQTADTDGDGDIDADDKLTYAEALAYATTLNNASFAGYTDWRVPSIKELYSSSSTLRVSKKCV